MTTVDDEIVAQCFVMVECFARGGIDSQYFVRSFNSLQYLLKKKSEELFYECFQRGASKFFKDNPKLEKEIDILLTKEDENDEKTPSC